MLRYLQRFGAFGRMSLDKLRNLIDLHKFAEAKLVIEVAALKPHASCNCPTCEAWKDALPPCPRKWQCQCVTCKIETEIGSAAYCREKGNGS